MPRQIIRSARASRCAVCSTLMGAPSLSMPPRICITQPGQSINTAVGAGLLDVMELAFENRRRNLGQLERVGAAHAAAHIGLVHLGNFVARLAAATRAEADRRAACASGDRSRDTSPSEAAALFQRQPALVRPTAEPGWRNRSPWPPELAPAGRGVGHAEAFKGAAEILLQRDGAGGAGRDDVADVLLQQARRYCPSRFARPFHKRR